MTLEKAYLWADGRYHIQAADQLKGSEIELVKWGLEGVPDVHEWLAENLEDGKCIGFDGNVVSLSTKRNTTRRPCLKVYIQDRIGFDRLGLDR